MSKVWLISFSLLSLTYRQGIGTAESVRCSVTRSAEAREKSKSMALAQRDSVTGVCASVLAYV